MYFYKKKLPSIDDIVFIIITTFSDSGTYCKLLEYNNVEGFILNTELDKKVYDPKKQFKFGTIYPMLVLDVSEENVNLSYRKVFNNKEDTKKYRERLLDNFNNILKISKLVEEFCILTKIEREIVEENTIQIFFDKNDKNNSEKLLTKILKDPNNLFFNILLKYSDQTEKYLNNLYERILTTDMLVHQNFKLVIPDENAIEKLKYLLTIEKNNMVEIKYVNAPIYQLIISCDSNETLKNIIDNFEKNIKLKSKDTNINCIFSLEDQHIIREKEFYFKPMNRELFV